MYIDNLENYNRIVIWGSGKGLEDWYHNEFKVDFIVDKDLLKEGMIVKGLSVKNIRVLTEEYAGKTLIVVSALKFYEEIKEEIYQMGIVADVVDIKLMNYIYDKSKKSFCLWGIDVLVSDILERSGYELSEISYIEVGANHPYYGSATANMYLNGAKGILIEPNPDLYEILSELRSRDKVITCGVAEDEGNMTFYRLDNSYRNTFDYEQVSKNIERGYELVDEILVPVHTLNKIIDENEIDSTKTYLSIQVMGSEKSVLNAFEYKTYQFPIISIAYYSDDVLDMPIFQDYKVIAQVPRHIILVKKEIFEKIYR